jgi:hypothetical protein
MPTISEQIAAANAKLDALVTAAVPAPVEQTVKLTMPEALVSITDELAKDTVTKERAAYLRSVLGELAKNFEATSFIELKVLNDPDLIKPVTEKIGTIQSLTVASPDSGFASNLTGVAKAQLIQKLLLDKVELKKSALTDKLEQIKSMFALNDADLNDSYDLRWKIGDLIGVLQNAIKLETMINGVPAPAATTTTATGAPQAPAFGGGVGAGGGMTKAAAEPLWPRDMASAKFDPVKKAYEPEPTAWGNDSAPKS